MSATFTGGDTGLGANNATLATRIAPTNNQPRTTQNDAARTTESGAARTTEASPPYTAGGDLGTGSESGTVAATASGADSALGADAGALGATLVRGDTGTGVEAGTLGVSASRADSGAALDAATVAAATSNADGAVGLDAGALGAALVRGDAGQGAESATLATQIAPPTMAYRTIESGAARTTEALAARTTDGLPPYPAGGDIGVGVEATTTVAVLWSGDGATGVEGSFLAESEPGADAGSATDAGTVFKQDNAVVPGSIPARSDGQTVRVTIPSAAAGDTARLDGQSRTTIYVGPNTLSVVLLQADLAAAQTRTITVLSANGAISPPATLTITPVVPVAPPNPSWY